MNNYKIVIDPGHGGDDPGASGNGIVEKDLTLDISKRMYDKFRQLGIPVTLTRTGDETLDPTERVERILNAYGNSNDVIVISNHINAGGGDGAEVIYALRNNGTLANSVLEALGNAGQNMRKAYQRRLPSNTAKDYYFIHRNTGKTQPIIVEYGFLDSTGDDVNQLKNDWPELTDAVVNAVVNYIGGTYSPSVGTYYTVKSGDSLWSIAKKYGVTVNELKVANNLTSNSLSIGQRLRIPIEEEDSMSSTYVVKSGDTLYAIARDFGTTVDSIKSLNNLTTNTLQVGQVLQIPGEVEEDTFPTVDYINYTVKSGDSLYAIARNYNVSVDDIKDFNNLTSNTLSIGQVLRIPVAVDQEIIVKPYIEYVVKSGDNLYSIARTYGTTQQEIMNLNNLTSNLLSIGQVLKIPTSTETINYIVKSGDNLYSIARAYGTTVSELINKNNLTSTTLQIGQVLKI